MDKAPASIVGALAHRRRIKPRRYEKSGIQSAAELIGKLEPGLEICGITNGQFSLIDILEHVLSETGPADVVIATWTMGIYDADRAHAFTRDRRIRSIRFMLDPSMFGRRPELASVLVQGFGIESFRGVNCHAKFATVRSESMAVAIRGSMNLNPNNRLENFDLAVDDELTRFFEGIADEVWRKVSAGNEGQSLSLFHDLLDATPVRALRFKANPFLAQG